MGSLNTSNIQHKSRSIFSLLVQKYNCGNETRALPRLPQYAGPTVATSFQKRKKESIAYLQQL